MGWIGCHVCFDEYMSKNMMNAMIVQMCILIGSHRASAVVFVHVSSLCTHFCRALSSNFWSRSAYPPTGQRRGSALSNTLPSSESLHTLIACPLSVPLSQDSELRRMPGDTTFNRPVPRDGRHPVVYRRAPLYSEL